MLKSYNVVVVEDEDITRELLGKILTDNFFKVHPAPNGKKAIKLINEITPDIVILDLGLPDMDGFKIIREMRTWTQIPIIVVSANHKEQDKVTALELGADDYITKPFGAAELVARIKNAIKHSVVLKERKNDGKYVLRELTVDFINKRVLINGFDAMLTKNEYRIVSLLAQNAGKVITYEHITKNVWGTEKISDSRIRVNMANIRKKIEEDTAFPEYIITEPGIGYKMGI
ncbi:MAG: response regulator transcription factor [Oscillospiraceae bacterium]|nr:response regulator transcription factor [Oscillospiraceae bacterium]